jgi:2-desacetyl-2-hydroxyethyl bacteriochlorophyllide A dehydrogenase
MNLQPVSSGAGEGGAMRSLVYTAPRQLNIEDYPRPHPAAGEVEIAVAVAGICGADISGFLGKSRRRTPPLILGHELVGHTAEGRRVVVDPLSSCGHCTDCQSGRENLCPNLRLLGMDPLPGCFADFVAVPRLHVYEIPEELADARAILAEPLANIVHVFRLAAAQLEFRMGIVGAGVMGALALKMALRLGAREVLVEDIDERRVAAARLIGATLAVNPESDGGDARSFAGRGLDLVLDACGTEDARQQAFDLCRPGGTVVLLGMAKERSELDFVAVIRKEQRVLMSFGYTPVDFARSLEMLAADEIDLGKWVMEMPLEDGQKAFEKMTGARSDTLKIILRVR